MTLAAIASKVSGNAISLSDWGNIQSDINYLLQQGANLASASTITVTNRVHNLTGTTTVNTITAGTVAGQQVTLVASGQAAGVCVVLAHHGGNISLRDGQNLGIYAGESLTFMWDGTYWTEVSRNLKLLLDAVQITSSVNITATTEAAATTVITADAVTFDGATPVEIEFAPSGLTKGTNYVKLCLYDGSSSIGFWDASGATTNDYYRGPFVRRLTPSGGTHTYSIRGFVDSGTGQALGGAGTVGAEKPASLTIRRDL